MESNFFRLDIRDLLRGVSIAFLTPIMVYLASALQVPGFQFNALDFGMLAKIGIGAMLGYLVKNFLSTSDGRFLGGI